MRIDMWSDYRCPWCYVGKRRLEEALSRSGVDAEVVYHAYELNPNTHGVIDGNYADLIVRKYNLTPEAARERLDYVARMASEVGLDYNFEIARPASTFDAHRLTAWAQTLGKADALVERLLHAYFTEGANLSDTQTLVGLAAEVGLDAPAARAVLESGEYADNVRTDEDTAARMGVTGVPFFVVDGREALEGAQPAEAFEQVFSRLSAGETTK